MLSFSKDFEKREDCINANKITLAGMSHRGLFLCQIARPIQLLCDGECGIVKILYAQSAIMGLDCGVECKQK